MFARFDPVLSAGVAAFVPRGPTQRPAENRAVESSASGKFPDSEPSLLSPERAVLELVRGSARAFEEVSQTGEREPQTEPGAGGPPTTADSRDPPGEAEPAPPDSPRVDLYA